MIQCNVGSRRYNIKFDKDSNGGHFDTTGSDGNGLIEVGVENNRTKESILETLTHELVEAILATDNKRWSHFTSTHSSRSHLFIFDHDYIDSFTRQLLTGLETSGAITINTIYPEKKNASKAGKGTKKKR